LCDICPAEQLARCVAARSRPDEATVAGLAEQLGGTLVSVTDRSITVEGLSEQPRYYIQHGLGYQVHDVSKRTTSADTGAPRSAGPQPRRPVEQPACSP
jgi:hypothetical protein